MIKYLLCGLVFLAGCEWEVSVEDIEKANSLCKVNGGVDYYIAWSDERIEVYCENGAFLNWANF